MPRTISRVKIRAVTLGMDLPLRADPGAFAPAAAFFEQARGAFELEVQTTRLAGPDLAAALGALGEAFPAGCAETEAAAHGAWVQYLSFGRVPAERADVVERFVA